MLSFQKSSFRGGLHQHTYSTRLDPSEYFLLVNGRTRRDVVEGIKSPRQDTSLQPGKLQGCYAAGNLVLLFIAGEAFIRDYSIVGSVFQQITTFSRMSQTVDFIYAELVPSSTVNFQRTLASASPSAEIVLTAPITKSPAVAAVCQDGINQPRLILTDNSARITKNYQEWTQDEPEYVPIGRQMAFSNGVLYTVSPNGLEIFRSCSGQPLNYMVNINSNGNKQPAESDGGAVSVSHAVSSNPITGIIGIGLAEFSGLFVSTLYSSHFVIPEVTRLLFGEPTFSNIELFSTGMVNQFCLVDLLGDTGFIDLSGIRSFNATQQIRNEGKNAPFSAEIAPLLGSNIQNICAAVESDNYAIFALQTIYGSAFLWYDTLNQSYTSIDIFPEITGKIKQFCVLKIQGMRKLFFITDDNKFYEYEASTITAAGSFFVGEWTGLSALEPRNCELKPEELKVVVSNAEADGELVAELFVDRKSVGRVTKPVTQALTTGVAIQPYGNASNNVDTVETLTFNFREIAKSGWKFAVFLSWNFKGEITDISATAQEILPRNSVSQQAKELEVFNRI
jgi:hypothetical protein